jgi:hypothetical protein
MDTPESDAAIRAYPEFVAAVRKRLDQGRRQYGDESFTRPIPEILEELSQELLDQAGWAFIGWTRIQRLISLIELSVSSVRDPASELGSTQTNL